MVALRQAMLQTALGFLANLEGLPDNGPEGFLINRTPEAFHTIWPASLQVPPKNSTGIVDLLGETFPGITSFSLELVGDVEDAVIIDEEKLKVVMHAKGDADTAIGNYLQEYTFTVQTTDDGLHVKNSWEMLDAVLARYWLDVIAAANE